MNNKPIKSWIDFANRLSYNVTKDGSEWDAFAFTLTLIVGIVTVYIFLPLALLNLIFS